VAVKIHVEFFWVVEPRSVVVVNSACIFVFTSPWRQRQHGPLKAWYPTTTLHDEKLDWKFSFITYNFTNTQFVCL